MAMKILVYGAGAIGSLMTHYLCRAGNDVTVVARSTYEEFNRNGLVIRNLNRQAYVDALTHVKNKYLSKKPSTTKVDKYDLGLFSIAGM